MNLPFLRSAAMAVTLSVAAGVILCLKWQRPDSSSAIPHIIEAVVELKTEWHGPSAFERRDTARCVIGTNNWFIGGDFSRNASIEYWQIDSNIFERTTITSSMYLKQAKDKLSELLEAKKKRFPIRYPRAGSILWNVHSSVHGGPPPNRSIEGAVWLALCSGFYLHQPGRHIPLPLGWVQDAFGYKDETTVFPDAFGLPQRVELIATNGLSVCVYEVLRSTNIFGRTLPLEFRLVQYQTLGNGSPPSGSTSIVSGIVTSIRSGSMPELPKDAFAKLPPQK